MLLRVNPNRMELLRLRRRLLLAQRGHKLLEDKLEELMRKFLALLKDIEAAKKEFSGKTKKMLQDLFYCRITSSKDEFEAALAKIDAKFKIAFSLKRVMNIKMPQLELKEFSLEKNYDFFKTSGQLDVAVAGARDYIRSLLKLAGWLKSLEMLSFEIERTRRRVNALEYMLIPSISDTIRYISQKLNEFERGNLVRLMRVKEIVRSH